MYRSEELSARIDDVKEWIVRGVETARIRWNARPVAGQERGAENVVRRVKRKPVELTDDEREEIADGALLRLCDALNSVARKRGTFSYYLPAPLKALSYSCARYALQDELRSRARKPSRNISPDDWDKLIDESERRRFSAHNTDMSGLRRAVSNLPERSTARRVAVLLATTDLSQRTIADKCKVRQQTVGAHVKRLRSKIGGDLFLGRLREACDEYRSLRQVPADHIKLLLEK